MTVLGQYKDCSTAGLLALDRQLIAQVQAIAPDALVSFSHLKVNINSGCHCYLQTSAVRALELAVQSRPAVRLTINSAYRTLAQQCVLYDHYQHKRCGISAAAVPGSSNHNTGLALDIENAHDWKPYLEAHSWDWLGSWDVPHFDYKSGKAKDLKWLSILAFQQLWNLNYPDKKLLEDGQWGLKTHQSLLSTSIKGFPKVLHQSKTEVNSIFPSLRLGMSGDAVKKLQQALIIRGIVIDADGEFGEKTQTAVKRFQFRSGLDFDGVVGIATINALNLNEID